MNSLAAILWGTSNGYQQYIFMKKETKQKKEQTKIPRIANHLMWKKKKKNHCICPNNQSYP